MARATIRTAIALGAAVVTLAACGDAGGAGGGGSDTETAKIGVLLPLTGENAENGLQIRNATELYVEQFNEADHGFEIELVVRDDRGEPKTATNIAREFAQDDDIIAVLGSFTSTASMAAAPIFDQAGIPVISPTSSHPEYTDLGEFVFRGTPTQDLEATYIAEYLLDNLGMESPAIVYRQDDWGNAAAAAFEAGVDANGGSIITSEAVAPDSREFRTLVTSLRETGADSLYLALHYSDAAVLAQQISAAGWDPTIITATSLYTHQLIELADEAVNGWNVPAFFFAESEAPAVSTFVEAYEAAYDEIPDAFGAVGYDSITVVGEALQQIDQLGSEGREALGSAMFDVEIEGATGLMAFDENGDVQKPITWLEIVDGEFVTVG